MVSDLINHPLLPLFPSPFDFLTSPPAFPGITFQITMYTQILLWISSGETQIGLPFWPPWPGSLSPEEEKKKNMTLTFSSSETDLLVETEPNSHSLRPHSFLIRGEIGSGVAKILPEVFVLRFLLPDTFISPLCLWFAGTYLIFFKEIYMLPAY